MFRRNLLGILRILARLLFSRPKARNRSYHSVERTKVIQTASPQRLPTYAGPNKVVYGIPIVECLRGRCYVVDGDTITIDKINIRLSGIDAPEMDQPFGKNAKWALFNLCNGHEIKAEFADHFSYERHIATCYLPDGRDLSAEMVKLGLALDWRKFSGGKYRHFEPDGVRRKLWRVDAKHKGQMPPSNLNG